MDYFNEKHHKILKDKVIVHLRDEFPEEIRLLQHDEDLSRFILDSIDEAEYYGIKTQAYAQLFIDIKVTLQCFQRLDDVNHAGVIDMLKNKRLGPITDRLEFICERVDNMLARKLQA